MSEPRLTRESDLRDHLGRLLRQLRLVHSGIVVAVSALRHQNAERDEEIATVLTHFVAARLADQIEQTEDLLASAAHAQMDRSDRARPEVPPVDGGIGEPVPRRIRPNGPASGLTYLRCQPTRLRSGDTNADPRMPS